MEKEFIKYILPKDFLEYFELTEVEELIDDATKLAYLKFNFVEKNTVPKGYNMDEYESKGFYEPKTIQDFPIRGKAVYLSIKRRRWRHKINKNEIIHNDYSFIAESSKITLELSDFLKDTGRDPRRHTW